MSDAFIFHEDYFDDFVDWALECMCSFPVSTDEFRLIATQYAETVLTDYEADGEQLIAELCRFGAERHLYTPD